MCPKFSYSKTQSRESDFLEMTAPCFSLGRPEVSFRFFPVFLPLSCSQVEKWAGFFVNPPVGGVSSFPVSYTCHVLQTDRRSCSLTDFCHQYGGKLMCLNSCVSQTVNHFSPLFPHPCPKAQAEVPSWKFSRCMIFQPHLLC